MIGSSNPGEPRGKVAPHGKGYVWVPVLWSFDKLMKVGVFSYLDIPWLCFDEYGCMAISDHFYLCMGLMI